MFKYDYKYAILLDKLRNGEDLYLFEFGYNIFRGWGKSPLLLDILRLIYHIHIFFILLYRRLPLHTCNV